MGLDPYILLVVLTLLNAIAAAFLYSEANKTEKAFFYLIGTNAFFEIVAWTSSEYFATTNNLPGLHLYTLAQFIAITFFFKACFERLSYHFNFRLILIIGVVLIVFNSLALQSIYIYNSYSKSMVELYIICTSLLLFISFLKDKKHDQQAMRASVSFISAVYLQSSISLVMYMYSNEIIRMQEDLADNLMLLRLLTNYFAQFMTILGLWQVYNKIGNTHKYSMHIKLPKA